VLHRIPERDYDMVRALCRVLCAVV
jgi:hypothetical protein